MLGLERIAEDGDFSLISTDFNANKTYVQGGVSGVFDTTPVGTRVDGDVGGGPILPGKTVMKLFEVTPDASNGWFSYVSMVLPSNDYYVANGNPLARPLEDLFTGAETSISFNIGLPGTVNDAGTEVEDFATSLGNGLFSGLPAGQPGPNEGADENEVNTNVTTVSNPTDPYDDFANRPANFDTEFPNLDFNNYTDGIARITITRVSVPESSTTVGLIAIAGLFLGAGLRRRHNSK